MLLMFIETLFCIFSSIKQRLSVQAAKLRRYEERTKQYHQNRLFESNQKSLYEEIDGIDRGDDVTPNPEESRHFWNDIWGKSVFHNSFS